MTAWLCGRTLIVFLTARDAARNSRKRIMSPVLFSERGRKFVAGESLGFFFEFDVVEMDGEAGASAEAFGELFGEEDGTVLAAGATEGDHQVLEAAGLVVGDAGVDERINRGEELMDAFLLV